MHWFVTLWDDGCFRRTLFAGTKLECELWLNRHREEYVRARRELRIVESARIPD